MQTQQAMTTTNYARIIGTGGYLPDERVDNEQLAERLARRGVQTSNEWIVERTGIHARHLAPAGTLSSDLALPAARAALQMAGLQADELDLIIVATSTPDMVFPSTASIVQHKLGVRGCPAFDVQAVCTGFIYALGIAQAMIASGSAKNALVIGAEVFSRLMDWDDRGTCVLFGDGAGAVVLQASDEPGILACDLHADGSYNDILCVPGQISSGKPVGDPFLRMDGQAVFKLAVNVLNQTAKTVLAKAGLQAQDVDWLVPHQANIRIMQSTAKRLRIPPEKVLVTVQEHGNTSAASVPLALDQGVREGKVKPGEVLLLEGVGGGFTWGSVLLKM